MIIETELEKMKSDGNDLKLLSVKYNKIIQTFKTKMKSLKGWYGEDADTYKKDVLEQILIFEDIGNALEEYANFLIVESNKIDQLAKVCAQDEKSS